MSMISELLERLDGMYDLLGTEYGYERQITKTVKEAAETIKELSEKLHNSQMERSSQYYNGGWIPCSERLPEKNGLYLVTQLRHSLDDIDYKRPQLGKEVDYVKYQDGWCGSRIFDVIAWMPLPEPWKGE